MCASAQVQALGLSIGQTVYSDIITHGNITPGHWGTVKGSATSTTSDANQRVLVEWSGGTKVNYLRSQLRNEQEQVGGGKAVSGGMSERGALNGRA